MKRILCYGDSNTWGSTPGTGRRYPKDIRWTGVMASLLGDEYEVIEAGLSGRTTVFDDPYNPYLNGAEYLPQNLIQAKPIDLVILSLGGNDLKFVPSLESARGLARLTEICKHHDALPGKAPVCDGELKILMISPIPVDECIYEVAPLTRFLPDAAKSSKDYAKYVSHFAKAHGVDFFDAATVAGPSKIDGLHMDPESHIALGKALAEKVKEVLG